MMAWRPAPPPSPGFGFPGFDERDTWAQRFISKTDDGELALDVNAMNGLETAAGAVFVDLIRQQAERQPSPSDSPLPSWMPGEQSASGRQHLHPPPTTGPPPTAQYEPFRCTYVSDPTCVPQLRFAHVSDTGADHYERETTHHWRRAGSTWSRVPRFRKGETAFNHDPNYKPPHAVVDKCYQTEAGPKLSLAGRVQESRWQSCHSMQTGREPRQPTRSRLPRESLADGPSPASYHIQDPWEVKAICGTIPKSRMFCKPVQRTRPQTSAFAAESKSCDVSVDTCVAANHDTPGVHRQNRRPRPATVAAAAGAAAAIHNSTRPARLSSAVHRREAGDDGRGGDGGENKLHRYRPRVSPTSARAATRAPKKLPLVGPLTFAREERTNITDERRKREENYGKKIVRLRTGGGNVLVTVNQRRTSAWGENERFGLRLDQAAAVGSREYARVDGRQTSAAGGAAEKSEWRSSNERATESPRRRTRRTEGTDGDDATPSTIGSASRTAGKRRVPTSSTPEAQAIKILLGDFAPTLPVYREPGRAEMPVIFTAKSAPIQRADCSSSRCSPTASSGFKRGKSGKKGTSARSGIMTSPQGADATLWESSDAAEDARRVGDGMARVNNKDEDDRVAKIVDAAEAAVASSGGGGGVRSVATRIPAPGRASTAGEDSVDEGHGGKAI